MQIPLYRHNLHGHDIDALGEEFKKLLRGMILSTGSVAEEIQQQFAAYMQTKHCLLTNNWTNATIAALLSLKIGPGDEVIVPAMTFVASANDVVEIEGAAYDAFPKYPSSYLTEVFAPLVSCIPK